MIPSGPSEEWRPWMSVLGAMILESGRLKWLFRENDEKWIKRCVSGFVLFWNSNLMHFERQKLILFRNSIFVKIQLFYEYLFWTDVLARECILINLIARRKAQNDLQKGSNHQKLFFGLICITMNINNEKKFFFEKNFSFQFSL